MAAGSGTSSAEDARAQRREVAPSDDAHRGQGRDHPLEESQKSYHTILEQQTTQADDELGRPAAALLLSGLAAGLDVGFGPFAMVVSDTLVRDVFAKPVRELLAANLYAVGFIFVVLGRSELFTEHTTSAVLPVLSRRASVGRLLRLWGLVLVANLAGAALFALFATRVGLGLGIVDTTAIGELAAKIVRPSPGVMFMSAVGAGWLMGLLAWLTTAARDTVGQILVIWLTTMVIGIAGLHHSIAGATEVLMGVVIGEGATLSDWARFELVSVLGNAVGGSVFVALLKFGHVRASRG